MKNQPFSRLIPAAGSLRLATGMAGLILVTGTALTLPAADPFVRINDPTLNADSGRFVSPSWGDYNNDGFIDLFVTADSGSSRLYENQGDGTFRRVEGQPAAGSGALGHAGVWGDCDNDGDLDLLLTRWEKGSLVLYLNQGDGTFSEVTNGEIARPGNYATGAAWNDYDRDGHLDLHVSNYGAPNWLFHNQGNGEFALVSGSPFDLTSANSMGCAWSDYDNDGIPDLFVGNSTRNAAYLFHGRPGGAFERIAGRHPATLTSGYWLGCDWGDYDNDGDPDLYVTSGGLGDLLYHNEGDGTFSLTSGVVPSAGSETTQPAWVDYDNDGWLDLYVTRGMNTSLAGSLLHNRANGTFEKILDTVITTEIFPSAGCCWGDYDNDGFQDLFLAGGGFNASHPNVLYRNTGNANTWLKLKFVGTASTRSGIGAKVRLRATIGGQTFWQLREISGGAGAGGAQNGLVAHFGLGDATMVEQVRIEWPSGAVQTLESVVPNQTLTVVEPPRIRRVSQQPGDQVRLEVSGWPGQQYRVDASSDLQTWAPLGTAVVENGVIEVADPDGSDAPCRFFRIVIP